MSEEMVNDEGKGAVGSQQREHPGRILGVKLGMTQVFDDEGALVPVTVIELAQNRISQLKTRERDGYQAIQVTAGFKKEKNLSRSLKGHLKKSGAESVRWLREFRVEDASKFQMGQELGGDFLRVGDFVDVRGCRIGRGFAGVMKRHGFHGADETHGTHEYRRHGGSIGQNTFPAKVFKGMRMAGRMGSVGVTTQSLKIVRVESQHRIVLIKGSVPGADNSLVEISLSVKKKRKIS